MRKRMVAILLCTFMVISALIGCGNNNGDVIDTGKQNTESQNSESQTLEVEDSQMSMESSEVESEIQTESNSQETSETETQGVESQKTEKQEPDTQKPEVQEPATQTPKPQESEKPEPSESEIIKQEDNSETESQKPESQEPEYQLEDIVYEVENEIIMKMLLETSDSVLGYKFVDLNNDNAEEIILAVDGSKYEAIRYYVIDKKNKTHISEYRIETSATGGYDLFIDEVNGKVYIVEDYSYAGGINSQGYLERNVYTWDGKWQKLAESIISDDKHTFVWNGSSIDSKEWDGKWSQVFKNSKLEKNYTNTGVQAYDVKYTEVLNTYKTYLNKNGLIYSIYEEDVDKNGSKERCIRVKNYLWLYSENFISEDESGLPIAFKYGLYQPLTKIILYNNGNKCKVVVDIDVQNYGIEKSLSDKELKEFIDNNYWYEYSNQADCYYVYQFNNDGTCIYLILNSDGSMQKMGEYVYRMEGDKVYLIDSSNNYETDYIYENGVLTHTQYIDDPIYGEFMYTIRMFPSKEGVSVTEDMVREYHRQLTENVMK